MKMDAMSRQGQRNDLRELTSAQNDRKLETAAIMEWKAICQTANYNRVQQQIKIPSDTYQTARSCL